MVQHFIDVTDEVEYEYKRVYTFLLEYGLVWVLYAYKSSNYDNVTTVRWSRGDRYKPDIPWAIRQALFNKVKEQMTIEGDN